MKKIYIVLTYTGTILSRIIKRCTKEKYAHISIGLDEELSKLYSFGRLNPYNAFIGGFVKEGINIGTFKRFKNTETVIYSLEVNDEQFKKAEEIINKIEQQKGEYKYNTIGMFLTALNIRINRKNAFYCAEFVKYILEKAEIIDKELPEMIKPMDFLTIENTKLEYEGLLKKYESLTKENRVIQNAC